MDIWKCNALWPSGKKVKVNWINLLLLWLKSTLTCFWGIIDAKQHVNRENLCLRHLIPWGILFMCLRQMVIISPLWIQLCPSTCHAFYRVDVVLKPLGQLELKGPSSRCKIIIPLKVFKDSLCFNSWLMKNCFEFDNLGPHKLLYVPIRIHIVSIKMPC